MDLTSEQRMTIVTSGRKSITTYLCSCNARGEEVAWACATSCPTESLKGLLLRVSSILRIVLNM